jgi:predicted ATP-grasp superfamily ATP-dependent carboligase
VFARRDLFVERTREWLWWHDVADVPRPRTVIRRGEPICTVFADAPTARECHSALVHRAARIHDEVRTWLSPE